MQPDFTLSAFGIMNLTRMQTRRKNCMLRVTPGVQNRTTLEVQAWPLIEIK